MPELISRIASSSAVASPARLGLDDALDLGAVAGADDAAVGPGVVEDRGDDRCRAPLPACVASRSAISCADTSGTSPLRTTTVSDSATTSAAARRAPPVPFASGCGIASTPSARAPEMSRSGETITPIRPAPASFAASIGHATSARPQIG